MLKYALCVAAVLALGPAAATADKNINGGRATWNCKKDPKVFINHGRGSYVFKGPCTSIYVNGGQNKLKIQDVETLTINGAQNKVDVGLVGSITISGTGNVVTWKTAKSGDEPTIDADTPATTTITHRE